MTLSAGRMWRIPGIFVLCWWEGNIVQSLWKIISQILIKFNGTPHSPTILLYSYQEKRCHPSPLKTYTELFVTAAFVTGRAGNPPNVHHLVKGGHTVKYPQNTTQQRKGPNDPHDSQQQRAEWEKAPKWPHTIKLWLNWHEIPEEAKLQWNEAGRPSLGLKVGGGIDYERAWGHLGRWVYVTVYSFPNSLTWFT